MSSLEVAGRCGVRKLGALLRGRRLGWFGHVVSRDKAEILGKTQLIEVPGRRPPGRLGRKNMQEELARGASSEHRSCGGLSSTVSLRENEFKRC